MLNIFLISQDGVTHIGPQKQVQEPQIGIILFGFKFHLIFANGNAGVLNLKSFVWFMSF